MIRIYTRNGHHDIPDALLSILGQIVAQSNSPVDVVKNATYTDIRETLSPEIDETEAVPVLEDVPEDPEITIERLNAKILELEAELEERRRSTDAVLEALRPLGTIVVDQAGVSTPETTTAPLEATFGDFSEPSIPAGVTGPQYFAAKAAYQAKQSEPLPTTYIPAGMTGKQYLEAYKQQAGFRSHILSDKF